MSETTLPSRFVSPERVIAQFGVADGMHIADFGCGSGHFTLAAAARAKESGKVYAIDIQQDLLGKLKNVARAARLNNIEIVWGDIEQPRGSTLPDKSMQAVLLTNILFQLKHKDEAIAEIKRVLSSGGRVLLVDWRGSFGNMGPREEDVVTEDAAMEKFENAGFRLVGRISMNGYHYGLIFKKAL